ncbi:MAG: C2 domain-containing protein [bacterium]
MWKRFLLVGGLLLTFGCSDDSATSEVSATNNGTSPEDIRDQMTIPNQPEVCTGCYVNGECKAGNERLSCGSGGNACVMCAEGDTCEDGVCTSPRNCTPANCNGCCDANDQCITGNQASACGAGGAACEARLDGTGCIDQRCVGAETCGPDNCAGCCDNGVCVTTTSLTQCGAGGGACQDCSAINGSTCGGAACVTPQCSQTCDGCCNGDTCITATSAAQCGATGDACVACPNGQMCSNGTCSNMTTVSGRWDIEIIDGKVDFWDYDALSSPDAYLDIYWLDALSQDVAYYWTDTDFDTYSPTWNETISDLSTDDIMSGILFEMYDEDLTGSELICDDMFYVPVMADFGGPIITTVCDVYPDVQVRWRIVPHAP